MEMRVHLIFYYFPGSESRDRLLDRHDRTYHVQLKIIYFKLIMQLETLWTKFATMAQRNMSSNFLTVVRVHNPIIPSLISYRAHEFRRRIST